MLTLLPGAARLLVRVASVSAKPQLQQPLQEALNQATQHWDTPRSAWLPGAASFRAHNAHYPAMEGDRRVRISCSLM